MVRELSALNCPHTPFLHFPYDVFVAHSVPSSLHTELSSTRIEGITIGAIRPPNECHSLRRSPREFRFWGEDKILNEFGLFIGKREISLGLLDIAWLYDNCLSDSSLFALFRNPNFPLDPGKWVFFLGVERWCLSFTEIYWKIASKSNGTLRAVFF